MALTEDTVAAAAARDRKKNTEELGAPVAQGTAETPRHPETETFKFAVSRVNPSIPDGEGRRYSA